MSQKILATYSEILFQFGSEVLERGDVHTKVQIQKEMIPDLKREDHFLSRERSVNRFSAHGIIESLSEFGLERISDYFEFFIEFLLSVRGRGAGDVPHRESEALLHRHEEAGSQKATKGKTAIFLYD